MKFLFTLILIGILGSCQPTPTSVSTPNKAASINLDGFGLYSKAAAYTFYITWTKETTTEKDTLYLLSYPSKPWMISPSQQSIFWVRGKSDLFDTTKMEYSGMIQSSKRTWFHPPRQALEKKDYLILEFCPFPDVRYPLTIGKSWMNTMAVPKGWSERVTQDLDIKQTYTITEKTKIPFQNTEIAVYKIESTSEEVIGKGELVSYFNEKIGFVRYEYLTIDKEEIVFQLSDIELMESFEKKHKKFDFLKF